MKNALLKWIAIRKINIKKFQMRPWDATEQNADYIGPSMKANGQIQPITIGEWEGEYHLIDGGSRLLSAKNRGEEEIEAKVFPVEKESDILRLQISANICRRDVDILSEARYLVHALEVMSNENGGRKLTYPEFIKKAGLPYDPNMLTKRLGIAKFDPTLDPLLRKIEKRHTYLFELGRIKDKTNFKEEYLQDLLRRIELDGEGNDGVTATMLKDAVTRFNENKPWELIEIPPASTIINPAITNVNGVQSGNNDSDNILSDKTYAHPRKALGGSQSKHVMKGALQSKSEEGEVSTKPGTRVIPGINNVEGVFGRWNAADDLLSVRLDHNITGSSKITTAEDWDRVDQIGDLLKEVAAYKKACLTKSVMPALAHMQGTTERQSEHFFVPLDSVAPILFPELVNTQDKKAEVKVAGEVQDN